MNNSVTLEKLDSDAANQRLQALIEDAHKYGLQGQLPEATSALKEAEELVEKLGNACSAQAKSRFLLEKGRILCLSKTPALARPLYIQAWHASKECGDDFSSIDAAQMMAAIEPPKVRIEWTQRALDIAQSTKQEKARERLPELYSTLGSHFFELRQYEKALEFYRLAASSLEKELTQSNPEGSIIRKINIAKCAIGKTLRAQGKFEEALQMQQDLLAELQRAGIKDGLVYEEMAECLSSLKRTGDAEVYYVLAHAELSKDEWLVDNKADRIKRLRTLAKLPKAPKS